MNLTLYLSVFVSPDTHFPAAAPPQCKHAGRQSGRHTRGYARLHARRTFSEKESLNSIFICSAPMKPRNERMPMMANMV